MRPAKGAEEFHPAQSIAVEPRLYAALIDMVLVGTGCLAALQANGALLPDGMRKAAVPGLLILVALFACEALTGVSVGKWMMRLRVVRIDLEGLSAGHATILQTGIRAAVRWLGPLIALLSALTKDMMTAGALVAVALVIVVCEIPACYITLFRRGGTIFDLAARTRVEPVQVS